jgi:hypothetical protein
MKHPSRRRVAFWAVLAAFLAWDWGHSPRIDLRFEPPLVAAGSGQVSAGGHCALPK